MLRTRHTVVSLASTLLLLLSACASSDKAEQEALRKQEDKSVEEIYNEALLAEQQGNLKKAADYFEDVQRLYPYSPWATQAEIMYAYTLYQDLRYEEAVVALEYFIELHPSHPRVDYVYYLLALCYYEQITDVGRDQKMTEDALNALTTVIRRFPDTDYARDASLKLDLTRDHLAGKEMDIGRFYLSRLDYIAAINRFKNVIDTYQTTTHTAEALHRLVEAYIALGIPEEAKRNAAVLGYNYPGSDWYEYSYELLEDKGLLDDKQHPSPKE